MARVALKFIPVIQERSDGGVEATLRQHCWCATLGERALLVGYAGDILHTEPEEVCEPLDRFDVRFPVLVWQQPVLERPLLAKVAVTSNAEFMLVIEVMRAEVAVNLIDEGIDGTVDAVVNNLLIVTGGDRSDKLYVHYMDDLSPAELKNPVLEEELETVRFWIPSLMASPHANLAALAPILQKQVAMADKAKIVLGQATQALKDFREVGGRKELVDQINAERKSTYGELGNLVHTNPQLMLGNDFPDRFFLHEQRRRKLSSKELKVKLDAAKDAIAELEARIVQTEAEEKAAADKKAKRKAKEQAKKLAEAQKKAVEAAAAVAALESEIAAPPSTP